MNYAISKPGTCVSRRAGDAHKKALNSIGKVHGLLLSCVIPILLSSCSDIESEFGRLAGFTQGTTFSIIYGDTSVIKPWVVNEDVTEILKRIDKSMSLYDDSSIISRINRNEDVIADDLFIEVFNRSKEISGLTGGAFDVTVGPLVRAWGFGPDEHMNFDQSKLDSLMDLVGIGKVDMKDGRIVKSRPGITLDFNAIAQGYSVDVICRYFDGLGIENYLVEIGGEVRVKGTKGKKLWKIGIDRPEDNNMSPGANLQAIIELKDKALATSGNYRKFYVEDGIKYSHTIDPLTGYPARNQLLSATIIAGDCTTADGLATACMVMGLEKAKEFISGYPGLDAYLIFSDINGDFRTWMTEGMTDRLSEN